MGLRMLNHSRRKRGIDDEDDIDEVTWARLIFCGTPRHAAL